MVLEDEIMGPITALEEDPEPAFKAQAAAALGNADIQVNEQLFAALTQVTTVPIMVAQPDEIMYEVELGTDEPNDGLDAPPTPPPIPNIAG